MQGGLRPVALRCRQLGMTILEVLVSLTLAGMFFATALPPIIQSYSRLKLADAQGRALAVAKSKAEELLSMPAGASPVIEGRVDGLSWYVARDDLNDRSDAQGEYSQKIRNYRISVIQSGQGVLASISVQRLER